MKLRFTRFLLLYTLALGLIGGLAWPTWADTTATAQENEAQAVDDSPAPAADTTRREDDARFWFHLEEGRWRGELSLSGGIHSGRRDRTGDMLFTSLIEYEVPVHAHATLGLRLLPLFVYDGPETVWGGGFGLSARLYKERDSYQGLFGEAYGHATVHKNQFVGNSSNFNFLIGAGVGYQFPNDWHVTLRFDHFSNSGIADRNAGSNTIGLGMGYRF